MQLLMQSITVLSIFSNETKIHSRLPASIEFLAYICLDHPRNVTLFIPCTNIILSSANP